MTQAVIGGILVKADGQRLTLLDRDNPGNPITLHGSAVHDFIDFVNNMHNESGEVRLGFRVPIATRMGLTVGIESGGLQIPATPINLSLTGILVRLQGDEHESLQPGTTLRIALRTRDNITASLDGTLIRRVDDRIGVLFDASVTGDDLNPPLPLLRVFKAMETAFVRQRTRDRDALHDGC